MEFSSRVGDRPEFLETNPCQTYKNVFSTVSTLLTTYKQTKISNVSQGCQAQPQ